MSLSEIAGDEGATTGVVVGPGDGIRVRRERWVVADLADHDGCRVLTLRGLGPANLHEQRRLLEPFEVIEPVQTTAARWSATSRTRWRRACRRVLAGCGDWTALHSADAADLDVLPHQLEPALAVLQGRGCRVLLADAVGLGKTIQAGILITELMARGAADRTLVLTPAGLRDQWAGELRDRFGRTATVMDLSGAGRLAVELPFGVNPWRTMPVAIASLDYVKRPEVLPIVRSCAWDIVVVDEAHLVTPDSDRYEAVSALCASAAWVVLLTATPHSGDRRAFEALRAVGRRNDPLIVFRRTRADVRVASVRRAHKLRVEPSAAELRMHASLRRYIAAVRRERASETDGDIALLLTTLQKRALSSPASLHRSIVRRLAVLGEAPADGTQQMWLPLDDGGGELNPSDEAPMMRVPAMDDVNRECRLLEKLADAAEAAMQDETKMAALGRLLRRLRRLGETAIVFTEYRDTLGQIQQALRLDAVLLHGGLTRADRLAAVRSFTAGASRLLLATDAGGEGLNLHHACRCVIHVELPWNPSRLEQRTGRVDRIGQRRTVHAFYLIARHSSEAAMLARLEARLARARHDIGVADPLSSSRGEDQDQRFDPETPAEDAAARESWPARAHEEAWRIALARRFRVSTDARGRAAENGRFAVRARGRLRAWLNGRALVVAEVVAEDASARRIASHAVPMLVSGSPGLMADAEATVARTASLISASHAVADAIASEVDRNGWRERSSDEHAAFWSQALKRTRAVADSAALSNHELFQPGLFDRRADRGRRTLSHEREDFAAEVASRVARFSHAAKPFTISVRATLVMLP